MPTKVYFYDLQHLCLIVNENIGLSILMVDRLLRNRSTIVVIIQLLISSPFISFFITFFLYAHPFMQIRSHRILMSIMAFSILGHHLDANDGVEAYVIFELVAYQDDSNEFQSIFKTRPSLIIVLHMEADIFLNYLVELPLTGF